MFISFRYTGTNQYELIDTRFTTNTSGPEWKDMVIEYIKRDFSSKDIGRVMAEGAMLINITYIREVCSYQRANCRDIPNIDEIIKYRDEVITKILLLK